MLLKDGTGVVAKGRNGLPEILGHNEIEKYLDRYCGLTLYLKEMDEGTYSKLCAVRSTFLKYIIIFLHTQRHISLRRANSTLNRLNLS